jgi:hypothetical protein
MHFQVLINELELSSPVNSGELSTVHMQHGQWRSKGEEEEEEEEKWRLA